MNYLIGLLIFLIGVLIGSIIEAIITYNPKIGKLRVDNSDDGLFMFLVLKRDPYTLRNGEKVVLTVDITDHNTHK